MKTEPELACRECGLCFAPDNLPGCCHLCGKFFCPQCIYSHKCIPAPPQTRHAPHHHKKDPFTSENARTWEPVGAQAAKLINDTCHRLCNILELTYGPAAEVRYRKYFGEPDGAWEAGYSSFFGFVKKGHGWNGDLAVSMAIAMHQSDDPNPRKPHWPLKWGHRHENWVRFNVCGDPQCPQCAGLSIQKLRAEAMADATAS